MNRGRLRWGRSDRLESVQTSLRLMDHLAKAVQEAPVIEWDEDVLDIVEPYFLFFLRSSTYLRP